MESWLQQGSRRDIPDAETRSPVFARGLERASVRSGVHMSTLKAFLGG